MPSRMSSGVDAPPSMAERIPSPTRLAVSYPSAA
jgi:hypothetical protein